MNIKFYNIHDFLFIEARIPEDFCSPHMLDALSYFQSDAPSKKTNILINIAPFAYDDQKSANISHRFKIKKNSIYIKGKIKKLKFEVEYILNDLNEVKINIFSSMKGLKKFFLHYSILQTIFILPILEIMLLKNELIVIGASTVSKNNEASLLVGRGGVFKTSIAMHLIRDHGYTCIGDDKIIIDKNRNVYSYQIFPKLLSYRLKYLENEFFNLFHKLNFLINQKKLHYDKVSTKSKLNNLIFVERCTEQYSEIEIPTSLAINKLTKNFILESSSLGIGGYSSNIFYESILAYSYIFPNNTFLRIEELFKEYIENIIDKKYYTLITGPNSFSKNIIEQIYRLIK